MAYFRERNKLHIEYSGNEEVSESLRNRLIAIHKKYTNYSTNYGRYIKKTNLEHELLIHLENSDYINILCNEPYDSVFEAVEIFIELAGKDAHNNIGAIIVEIERAFLLSGSVYEIDKQCQISLKVDRKTAERLNDIEAIFDQDAKEKFFDSVGKFLSRKLAPKDTIKDVFVAFEDYLKEKLAVKDYSKAIEKLKKEGIISNTQKALLEKIYAYRSDTYGVTHAGNSEEPKELEAVWFIDTVSAQIIYLSKKI